MDKFQVAHEFAMMRMQKATAEDYLHGVSLAWAYADAMQAEADKRKEKGVPESIKFEKLVINQD